MPLQALFQFGVAPNARFLDLGHETPFARFENSVKKIYFNEAPVGFRFCVLEVSMYFAVRKIFTCVCLWVGFLAVAVFADIPNCDVKGQKIDGCVYARIGATKQAQLFVTANPDDYWDVSKALSNEDFQIYTNKSGLSSVILSACDDVHGNCGAGPEDFSRNILPRECADRTKLSAELTNRNTGACGVFGVAISGVSPVYNVAVGSKTNSQASASVVAIYNFYAPEIEYCKDVDCKAKFDASSISKLDLKLGDTLTVYARLVIPVGPDYGKTDKLSTDASSAFYFSTTGASKNLVFMDLNGVKQIDSDGKFRLVFKEGLASFKVTATTAITDGSSFTVEGLPVEGEFQTQAPFPGSLEFQNPDFPPLDSALIFDSDGDGKGDSIVAYFRDLGAITVTKFSYNWPKDGTMFPGDTSISKNVITLRDVDSFDPKSGIGPILVAEVTSKLSGKSGSVSAAVSDRVGPVIESATIIKGSGKTDTLVVRFNKDIDKSWNEGKGFLNIDGVAIDVTALKKEGDLWTYVLPKGAISAGDSIKIAATCGASACPEGPIKTSDGLTASPNNRYVQVKSSGRVYVDSERNGFFDRDGDGKMDSAAITFEMPINESMLSNMEMNLVWLNSKGEAETIALKNLDSLVKAHVVELSKDGTVLGVNLSSPNFDIKQMLTSIDTAAYGKDYGYVEIFNKELVDGKEVVDTLSVYLNDKMSPVISSTFLKPESFLKLEADELVLEFSEPVADSLSNEELEKAFLFSEDGITWKPLPFGSVKWNENRTAVTIRLEAGESLKDRMNPADFIKLDPAFAGFADKSGNGIAKNTPVVMMKGDPRVVMETSSMASLKYADKLSNNKDFTFAFKDKDFSLASESGASLGVLMDVGFSTIMKDSSGTDASSMDLGQIGLSWEMYVYTNLGAYVSSASGKVMCNDKKFDGNCFENPKQLYVRWNMRSKAGRKVGVGVYLARFKVHVFGAKETFEYERFYNWGVKAGKGGLDYDNLGE